MTRAEIQALIDARGEVTLPHTGHYLDGPLIMRDSVHLNLAGGTLLNWFDRGQPCIVTPLDGQACRWGVRNGALIYGGIALRPGTAAPNFFELERLYIAEANCAYDARACDGAWMGKLSNVVARECIDGFRQVDGTTMAFDTCFANYCSGHAWNIDNVYAASLRSCAADGNSGQVRFANCEALSIASWYMEGNPVMNRTFLLIDACCGEINGVVSLGNMLSAESSSGAYLVQINASRLAAKGLLLGGSPKRNPDTASGGGLSQILLVSVGSSVVLSASEVYHADTEAGAGPASALVGNILDGGGNVIGNGS